MGNNMTDRGDTTKGFWLAQYQYEIDDFLYIWRRPDSVHPESMSMDAGEVPEDVREAAATYGYGVYLDRTKDHRPALASWQKFSHAPTMWINNLIHHGYHLTEGPEPKGDVKIAPDVDKSKLGRKGDGSKQTDAELGPGPDVKPSIAPSPSISEATDSNTDDGEMPKLADLKTQEPVKEDWRDAGKRRK